MLHMIVMCTRDTCQNPPTAVDICMVGSTKACLDTVENSQVKHTTIRLVG